MNSTLEPLGRSLIIVGLIFVGIGLVLLAGPKVPWLGRLPGDIAIRRDGFSFYVPLTSSIVVSLILSLLMWLIGRFRR